MNFACKSCGEEICLFLEENLDLDFIQVWCSYCGDVSYYSLVRLKAC